MRYSLASNNVRRHRLISISYLSLLPCHGRGREFESPLVLSPNLNNAEGAYDLSTRLSIQPKPEKLIVPSNLFQGKIEWTSTRMPDLRCA